MLLSSKPILKLGSMLCNEKKQNTKVILFKLVDKAFNGLDSKVPLFSDLEKKSNTPHFY